jgi:small subunit ribosomal protein S20
LANTKQAKKRARQSEKHRQNNASQRSMIRTHIKGVIKALDSKKNDVAKTAYQETVVVLDRLAAKGQIHKKKAARHKSRLNARLKALAGK